VLFFLIINNKIVFNTMAKTEITAKQLYENRNTSDVFSRLVIMGVLRVLNQKLRYTQVWEDTEEGT
jgi:hypothetical protein